MVEQNWAGNVTYRAQEIARPTSTAELQELVGSAERVRAVGSRHSFTELADTDGILVGLSGLPEEVTLDETARTVTVGAGQDYATVATAIEARGWALANLASLPHISVAGAAATGTHGSGDGLRSLAGAVAAIELVGSDGELRTVARGDEQFEGSVVALGALGIVTRLTLDVEPSYTMRQDVYTGLPWPVLEAEFDAITSSADSVSLFTRLDERGVLQVWRKSRSHESPADLHGAPRHPGPVHPLDGAPTEAVTDQSGEAGPWLDRLPHFRGGFTPSRGEELQSEYLVDRSVALDALAALRWLEPRIAPLLQTVEIRTVASDELWLSSSYRRATVGFHFTWHLDEPGVYAVLPAIEAALLPLGARPHWGKCFVAAAEDLAPSYPRWDDFRRLRATADPGGKFGNAFLDRVIGTAQAL
ncbi:xylitol oxidase [Phycicoccus badiiscoriae]|uniref:Xylitol oxidase n=1 Tax=Pedococcus badiiscoriae TaxID=642776 RepID=A0A852WIA6_9MICO|nr:D-arabinono-1,4-lactone oxidase [Pedococcus badiiscoriae]NYG06394.1 xylitol oxidase [Pedococcus badiiscoriae]